MLMSAPRGTSLHGERRMRERIGLSKKSIDRQYDRVIQLGKDKSFYEHSNRRLFRYMSRLEHQNRARARKGEVKVRVYSNNLYIFGDDDVLITTWVLPTKFRTKRPQREHEWLVEELEEA